MRAKLELHFSSSTDPRLTRSVFAHKNGVRGPKDNGVEWPERLVGKSGLGGFPWREGVRAFCLLCVRAYRRTPFLKGVAAYTIAEAWREAQKAKARSNWQFDMLGKDRNHVLYFVNLVHVSMIGGPEDCEVELNAAEFATADSISIFIDRNGATGRNKPSGKELEELENALSMPEGQQDGMAARLERRYARACFHIGLERATGHEVGLYELAAEVLFKRVNRLLVDKRSAVIGVTGGSLQLEVAGAFVEKCRRNGFQLVGDVRIVACSHMYWLSDRRRLRGPDFVGARLAEAFQSANLLCPPLVSGIPALAEAFENAVNELDLMLVSGGSMRGSFIDQFFALAGKGLGELGGCVGDLAGILLGKNGMPVIVSDPKVADLLAQLRCHPTLEALKKLAASDGKDVIIALDDVGGTKLPLLKACLLAGVGKTYVIPEHLARALLR